MANKDDQTCDICRWWSSEVWSNKGTCMRLHCGGGGRDTARIFPNTSGAYLQTPSWFSCCEFEISDAAKARAD
jgi:hypothetical protein